MLKNKLVKIIFPLLISAAISGCSLSGSEFASMSSSELSTSDTEDAENEVIIYSSLQEKQLDAIKHGFESTYPEITLKYVSGSSGNLITRIYSEQQLGNLAADVLLLGSTIDYMGFKNDGILQSYVSPEVSKIPPEQIDINGLYTGARYMDIGFIYNTDLVSEEEVPSTWKDLLDPKWKNKIIMTDPEASTASKYFVSALLHSPEYGPEYLKALKSNGCQIEPSDIVVNRKLENRQFAIAISVDYMVDTSNPGDIPLAFSIPQSDRIRLTTPIALVSNAKHEDNGRLLIDYILSAEGQRIFLENSVQAIRKGYNNSYPDITMITVDESAVYNSYDQTINSFDEIFN